MKIGVGRYGDMLAKLFTGTATLEVTPDLSAEVSPVFVLENDRPEWLYLGNQRIMACRGPVTSGAAASGVVRLRNPSTSNVLCVVESITVTSQAIADISFRLGVATTDLGTPLTVSPRDSRWQGTLTGGAVKFSTTSTLGFSGNEFEEVNLAVNTPYRSNSCPVVIAPGAHLDVGATTFLAALCVNFRYRERAIGKYEA